MSTRSGTAISPDWRRNSYATADVIRTRLIKAGLTVEDTPSGTRWELQD